MKNKHQLEIMARYMAFLAVGAKNAGLAEESRRAGSAVQLLEWVCDHRNPSSEPLDAAYATAKSAYRELKKAFPEKSMEEMLELLPSHLLDTAMAQIMNQAPPTEEARNE